ncbi:MAG: hypothetical protein M1829_002656 [Trizodia sp. TS-e1964]|nr:MAG: hypothetical protein M1829_002656 [Trizodia sp. TS-e1964]
MAKADASRDYYADLELKAGADLNDIKKQFKKLALKYHPDRNPGHELEFNSKFQAIQAAHEILTDPELKLKYDIDRARLYRPYSTPLHGRPPMSQRNPFNPSTAWDPPPPSFKTYASTPSNRASQYATYGKGFGKERSTAQDDTEAKLRAWKNMRNRASAGGNKPPPPPEPPKRPEQQENKFGRSQSSYARSKPDPNPFGQPPTPIYTEQPFGRTKSARTPRKAGFAPGDDGGDEPAAPNTSAYASYFKRHASSPHLKPEAPEPALPPRNPPNPLGQFKSQFMPPPMDSPRVSTPYATAGGEKTYFSSSKLGRSKSTRVSPTPRSADTMEDGPLSDTAEPSVKPTRRQRKKAYDLFEEFKRGNLGKQQRQWQPEVDSDNDSDTFKKSFVPPSYETPNEPTCEPVLKTMYKDELERRNRSLHNRKDSPSRHSARRVPNPENGFANIPHNPIPAPDNKIPPKSSEKGDVKNTASSKPFWPGLSNWEKENSTRADYEKAHGKQDESLNGSLYEARSENIFTFELGNETPIPLTNPKLPSPRNIDTRFSPTNWTSSFFGAATGPQQSQQNKGSRASGRKSPIRSFPKKTADPYAAPLNNSQKNIPPMPPPKIPIPATSPGAVKFEKEYWAQTFKEPSWIPPPHPPPSPATGANIRAKVTSRPGGLNHKLSSKATPRRAGPQARNKRFGSDTESDSSKSEESIEPDEGNLDSGPMDVDSPAATEPTNPVPEVPPRPDYIPKQNGVGARTAPPIPTRSEWVHLPPPTATDAAPQASVKSMFAAKAPPVPPRGNQTAPSPPVQLATPPEIDANTNINLDDLQRVEPLAPSQNGLKNLGELSTSLPFESRAASHAPGEEFQPQRLALPKVPRAPIAPFPLTKIAWEQYLAHAETYMNEWHSFNHMMLAHFNSRQLEVTNNMTPGWLGIMGEGPAGGFGKYMKGIEEDFRVRQHWNVAWEKHRATMKEFGHLRERSSQ